MEELMKSALTGENTVAPLPFSASKLRGISERMILSHHENNYAGAVKNLNKVELELARVTKETPPFVVAGLKERELAFSNSAILHERYFRNLGGDGRAPTSMQSKLAGAYGSFARWEELFRATALGLAGGSGWVILAYDFHKQGMRTYMSGHHSQSVAFGAPLLVLDMYEHSYAIDYGAAAAKYVDAFFDNVSWEEVERRLAHAEGSAT
jgi:superoxide dismutase, Fe-Mn family